MPFKKTSRPATRRSAGPTAESRAARGAASRPTPRRRPSWPATYGDLTCVEINQGVDCLHHPRGTCRWRLQLSDTSGTSSRGRRATTARHDAVDGAARYLAVGCLDLCRTLDVGAPVLTGGERAGPPFLDRATRATRATRTGRACRAGPTASCRGVWRHAGVRRRGARALNAALRSEEAARVFERWRWPSASSRRRARLLGDLRESMSGDAGGVVRFHLVLRARASARRPAGTIRDKATVQCEYRERGEVNRATYRLFFSSARESSSVPNIARALDAHEVCATRLMYSRATLVDADVRAIMPQQTAPMLPQAPTTWCLLGAIAMCPPRLNDCTGQGIAAPMVFCFEKTIRRMPSPNGLRDQPKNACPSLVSMPADTRRFIQPKSDAMTPASMTPTWNDSVVARRAAVLLMWTRPA